MKNVPFHVVYSHRSRPHNLQIKSNQTKVEEVGGLKLKDPLTLELDQEKGTLKITSRTFEMVNDNISKKEKFRIFVMMWT